jgi:hypothetical protein
MAYNKWNSEIGQLQWDYVEVEKREIYGNNIMDSALANIKECWDQKEYNKEYPEYISSEFLDIESSDFDEFLIGVFTGMVVFWGVLVFILVIFLIGLYVKYEKRILDYFNNTNKDDEDNV